MRRLLVSLLPLLAIACKPPAPSDTKAEGAKPGQTGAGQAEAVQAEAEAAKPEAKTEWEATRRKPPENVRKDLVAEDLPPVPTLEIAEHAVAEAGSLPLPEGSDELAPRAAIALKSGLLLAGQAYLGRVPGRPSKTWRWLGLVAAGAEPRSTKSELGAVRAAIAHEGGALLVGTSGFGFDTRGWFAIVDATGEIDFEVTLESSNTTELFDLVPADRGESGESGELAVVGGYVDAMAWLVSLDRGGMPRWQRYIGSSGYTQVRGLARLNSSLLAIGTRADAFGQFWFATSPATGEGMLDATGVEEATLTIEGADKNQMLRVLVDGGEHGLFALGTAKRNYIQAHDQVLAVAFDRSGKVRWSKVVPELRATQVHGGRARAAGGAYFVVSTPGATTDATGELALVELGIDGETKAGQLADSTGWSSAGFVKGEDAPTLATYLRTSTGLDWRRSILPG